MMHLARFVVVGSAVVVTAAAFGCSEEAEGFRMPSTTTTSSTTTSSTTTSSTSSTSTASGGSGGSGAEGGGGGEGGSGGGACVPVTVGEYQDVMTQTAPYAGSNLIYLLDGLNPLGDNTLWIEFYDVAGPQVTGEITLGVAPDDNYDSCPHCLLAYEDDTLYFAASGTMQLTTADTAYAGVSAGSFENVELVEVTLDGTTTTPVPNGRCLLLNGSWDNTP